jgi:hypothetical protein
LKSVPLPSYVKTFTVPFPDSALPWYAAARMTFVIDDRCPEGTSTVVEITMSFIVTLSVSERNVSFVLKLDRR